MVMVIVSLLGISCSNSKSSNQESKKQQAKKTAAKTPANVKQTSTPSSSQAPPEKFHHGGMTKISDFVVKVPEDVKTTWKKVVLSIHVIKTRKQKTVVLPIGRKTKIQGTPFKIEVVYFLPNFTMGGSLITSKDNEQKNPAAKVRVYQDGTLIWTGWLFQRYPQVHPFTHVDYHIFLVKGLKK